MPQRRAHRLGRVLPCLILVLLWLSIGSFAAQNPWPWRSVPILIVALADDDGGRAVQIDPRQIREWVDFTNHVFASARVRFVYRGDSQDTISVRSTILNSVMESREPTFREAVRQGNAIAGKPSGRLTVLVRWGSGERPSGNGFSSYDYNFVVMSPFDAMSHCGHAHIDALAHEIGHYLGLPHTFPGEPFPTREAAAEYLRQKGGDSKVFDGDGFEDTPPDPAIRPLECERVPRVVLNGITFTLPRRNIMSYYDERDSLTPQQAGRVRWMLDKRQERGMSMPTNLGLESPIEAESLPAVETRGAHAAVQSMEGFGLLGWSGGKQLFCDGPAGSSISLRFEAPCSGRYRLDLYLTMAPDFGIVQCAIDGRPLGGPLDLYAPFVIPSGRIALGTVTLKGSHTLTLTSTGKSPLSTGTKWGIDALELSPAE